MFVPSGYVRLLEAVEKLAAQIEPSIMARQKPDGLAQWERITFAMFARAKAVSISDSVPSHPRDAAKAKVVLEVDSERLVLPPKDERDRLTSEWKSTEVEQEKVREKVRANLLQALGDKMLRAFILDKHGTIHVVPVEPWRTIYGPFTMKSGQMSFTYNGNFEPADNAPTEPFDIKNPAATNSFQRMAALSLKTQYWGTHVSGNVLLREAEFDVWRAPRKAEVQRTVGAEKRFEAWLADQMRQHLSSPEPKAEIRQRGQYELGIEIPGKAFDRAWQNAIQVSGAVAWRVGGKRKRSS